MASKYGFHQMIVDTNLNKSIDIKAETVQELELKIALKRAQWNEEWKRKQETEKRRQLAEKNRAERKKIATQNEEAANYASQLTTEAENTQDKIEGFLTSFAEVPAFDFDALKDHSLFSKPKPTPARYAENIEEPRRDDAVYNPKPGLFTRLFKMDVYNKQNEERYERDHNEWERRQALINEENASIKERNASMLKAWEEEKTKFEKELADKNKPIEAFEENVKKGDFDVFDEFISLRMSEIKLPFDFDLDFRMAYVKENRSLIVEVKMPTADDFPKLKSVKYMKTKQEFKETYYTDSQIQKKYDNFIYQLVLVVINYAFSVNKFFDVIDGIVLNGIVDTIDKTTGNSITVCVVSLRVSRENFEQLNLGSVDSKAWFRSSKGIAAASIANVTPVQPVQMLNKDDDRFIEGYNVVENINEGVNLAAIDWQDFENLIREVFAEEFSSTGGEVKVTQASRDGGVDAVAFDPDPIRGGKIVIQAKRYTNAVGVSAVRDLYGTLMNEGAMKGILVTTSYFGNDAYDFANGKPLQLIDGAQLLGLLERHGHKARINLKEAKAVLKATEG